MVYAAELVPRMPMFNNLVDLEFLSPWSIDLDCAALWTLLQKSPCLKALKFSGVISSDLQCLLSCICSILLLIYHEG
jgi:hypothetical protein